jgi:hypothetical protein
VEVPPGTDPKVLTVAQLTKSGLLPGEGEQRGNPGFDVSKEAIVGYRILELIHLGPSSPAIDVGAHPSLLAPEGDAWSQANVAAFEYTDVDGEDRPQQAAVDMGADERTGSVERPPSR